MIDIDSLPSLPVVARKELPPVAAVYLAIDSLGNIQYIGRSVNLQQRWTNHHREPQLQGARIAWLSVDSSDLLPEIEE